MTNHTFKDGERHPKFWALKWCFKLQAWVTDGDDALIANFPVQPEPAAPKQP